MSEHGSNNHPPSAWQAEILRMTAFPSPTAQIGEPRWWADLTGEPPENRIENARRGGLTEEGPFESGKLVLRIEPARIDWRLILTDEQQQTEVIPSLGSFPEVLGRFSPLMRQWLELESCPHLVRLAFGAILFQPVDDPQTGYQQIQGYLPNVQLDATGASDFLYRINRPRDSISGVSELRINRLTTWSVGVVTRSELAVDRIAMTYFPGQQRFFCRLELDINTAPNFPHELPQEMLPRIFEELVDLGQEIAREGDIP